MKLNKKHYNKRVATSSPMKAIIFIVAGLYVSFHLGLWLAEYLGHDVAKASLLFG